MRKDNFHKDLNGVNANLAGRLYNKHHITVQEGHWPSMKINVQNTLAVVMTTHHITALQMGGLSLISQHLLRQTWSKWYTGLWQQSGCLAYANVSQFPQTETPNFRQWIIALDETLLVDVLLSSLALMISRPDRQRGRTTSTRTLMVLMQTSQVAFKTHIT